MVNPIRLNEVASPFLALKTAQQFVDFAIDPSKGLSRRRYAWHTNNTLFDDTAFSDTNVPGAIEITTGTSGTDTARIRSAFAGQYQSQSLGVPGQGVTIDSSNISQDSNNLTSMDNGLVAIGAGWHEGGSGGWSVGSNNLKTFIGFKIDTDGMEAVLVSDGEHLANSPVKQENWNINSLDGHSKGNEPAEVIKPQDGYIYNEPYTWYNEGAIFVGFIPPSRDKLILAHRFEVEGNPNLDRPNLPCQLILDNNGDSQSVTAELGGVQYSRYGSGGNNLEARVSPTSRSTSNNYISNTVTKNNNSVDPRAEPGKPLVSVRRQTGERDTRIKRVQIETNLDTNAYLFIWDEFNDSTALTGENFRTPHVAATSKETKLEVDTEATDYSPTTTSFRDWIRVDDTSQKDVTPREQQIDVRVPIDATRIITAVNGGTNGDVEPIKVTPREGF